MKRPLFRRSRSLKALPLLSLLAILSAVRVRADAPPPALGWRTLAPDLEITTVTDGVLSADLVVVRTSLSAHRIGIVRAAEFGMPRASVRQLSASSGAVVGINANFFDEAGRPLGLVVSHGSTFQRVQLGGQTLTGILLVNDHGPRIIGRADYTPTYVSEAVQAGPRLVTGGAPVTTIKHSGAASRRAGGCIDRAGRLLLFIVSSGLLGMTLEDLQQVLVRPGIDCVDALNLDGGGSAQLFVRSPTDTAGEIFFPGKDDVPVMLGLFRREGAASSSPK